MIEHNDSYYMQIALDEAKKGLGFTSPNPLVGAVIVKNNNIIGKGYHHKIGSDHAEVDAIKKVKDKNLLIGSVLYVNLEPCSHFGKTPPCTDAIKKTGVRKVVIANKDIDSRVSGIKILKKAGIEVKTGIMEKEGLELNSLYFHFKKNKKPYIIMKAALTLDGKIAAFSGDSKWISNESSRKIVHKLRLYSKAIAAGKNTILKDKPRLNCRIKGFEDKPVDKILFSDKEINIKSFGKNSGRVFFIDNNKIKSKNDFYDFCLKNEIDSVLVEGGSKIYTWFLEKDLADKIYLFYRPAFLGADGINVVSGSGIKSIKKLSDFKIADIRKIDDNFLVELYKGQNLCLPD